MARFLTELDVHLKAIKETVWVLDSLLVYESDLVSRVEAAAGFETDLASVPRVPIILS